MGSPSAEELGFAKSLKAVEIGGTNCLLLEQDVGSSGGGIATVVLRAATDNVLDDLERAVDDGVNAYKVIPSSMLFLKLLLFTSSCNHSSRPVVASLQPVIWSSCEE